MVIPRALAGWPQGILGPSEGATSRAAGHPGQSHPGKRGEVFSAVGPGAKAADCAHFFVGCSEICFQHSPHQLKVVQES